MDETNDKMVTVVNLLDKSLKECTVESVVATLELMMVTNVRGLHSCTYQVRKDENLCSVACNEAYLMFFETQEMAETVCRAYNYRGLREVNKETVVSLSCTTRGKVNCTCCGNDTFKKLNGKYFCYQCGSQLVIE